MALKLPRRKIAVTPMFDADMTASKLLYIPDVAKGRSDQGLIKYIGPDCKMDWTIGEYVLFSGYTGTLTEIDGELLIIMPEEFIIASVPDPDNNVTEIPGLYFKGTNSEHYQATFEMAMELIRDALQDTQWYKDLNLHKGKKSWEPEKPSGKDYNRTKELYDELDSRS
jgi:co-chaperonin GroES (HSP10)